MRAAKVADAPPIGVLALQGGFAPHAEALVRAGCAVREVRTSAALEGLGGLVLPGGESSVMNLLLAAEGLDRAIVAFARSGRPILATCAGLILLAREVQSPAQASLGLIDVAVARNAWGRQLASFEARDDAGLRSLVFIRAPRIRAVGPGVEVLARLEGEPVLVRQGAIVGATYHPELDPDATLHHEIFGAVRDEARPPRSRERNGAPHL